MGCRERAATIVVRREHVIHIRRVTVQVHIVAANLLDKAGSRPHANAPAIPRVGTFDDAIIPLEGLLASDLPEIASWPPRERLSGAAALNQLSAHSVRGVMVALEIAITRTLTRANGDVSGVREAQGSKADDCSW